MRPWKGTACSAPRVSPTLCVSPARRHLDGVQKQTNSMQSASKVLDAVVAKKCQLLQQYSSNLDIMQTSYTLWRNRTSSGIMTSGTPASNTTLAASGSVCICMGAKVFSLY